MTVEQLNKLVKYKISDTVQENQSVCSLRVEGKGGSGQRDPKSKLIIVYASKPTPGHGSKNKYA